MAAGLAACGGTSSSTPSAGATATPTGSATATPTPKPSGSATATPTASPTGSATATATPTASPTGAATPTYVFPASTKATLTLTANQTPPLVTEPTYDNITITAQFAAPSVSGTLIFNDGLDNGDVTPTVPADNAATGYTPVVYLSVYNPGTTDISFGANIPQISVADSAGFGSQTTCNFDSYSNHGGSGLAWNTLLSSSISGNTVTFGPTSIAGNTVDFEPGQQIVSVACH